MKRFMIIILGSALFLAGSSVWGQGPEMRPCDAPRMQEQHRKNLESLRLLKLLEALDLDEEKSPQFVALFSAYRKEMRKINDSVRVAVERLGTLMDQGMISDAEIRQMIIRIERLRAGRDDNIRRFHAEADKLLSAVQMGRLVLFEERFERELIENVRGFRSGHMPAPDEP